MAEALDLEPIRLRLRTDTCTWYSEIQALIGEVEALRAALTEAGRATAYTGSPTSVAPLEPTVRWMETDSGRE